MGSSVTGGPKRDSPQDFCFPILADMHSNRGREPRFRRAFAGREKTLQCCHPEPIRCHSGRSEESRSAAQGKLREGSRSEYFHGKARFFVAAAPQNDSAFKFFRNR